MSIEAFAWFFAGAFAGTLATLATLTVHGVRTLLRASQKSSADVCTKKRPPGGWPLD
jgi:hypothetical protein